MTSLHGSVTFPQFMPGKFVNSHLLSFLQFFHFMDISDASISKCFFSLSQFFVKSGLLSSRFFIPITYVIHFQTIGVSLSLKFTNASVESIKLTFMPQDFGFCFCELMISLFFKNSSRSFVGIRTWRKFDIFLELVGVLRKCLLCRQVFLGLTSLCVRT